MLLPLIAITGRNGIHLRNREGEKIFRFSKTLIYTFVGWLEGVLICLAGYAKHIGEVIKVRDRKMMNLHEEKERRLMRRKK